MTRLGAQFNPLVQAVHLEPYPTLHCAGQVGRNVAARGFHVRADIGPADQSWADPLSWQDKALADQLRQFQEGAGFKPDALATAGQYLVPFFVHIAYTRMSLHHITNSMVDQHP